MFNETVAQNPTTPVSEGTKKRKNSPNVWNFDGAASMGPNPPAFPRAQRRSASPISSKNGAEMPWRKRMVSIPRRITATFSNQNAPKQTAAPYGKCFQPGASATIMALMASPPIHV